MQKKSRRRPAGAAPLPVRFVPMGRRPARASAALSVAGAVVSGVLTVVHWRLHRDIGWRSFCSFATTIDCDSVLLSRFSAIGRVPLSAIAVVFYLIVGVLAVAALRDWRWRLPRSIALVLTLLGGAASIISLVLALVSGFLVHSVCALCALLYGINIALLVVGWRAVRAAGERLPDAFALEMRHLERERVTVVFVGIGLCVAALGLVVVYRNGIAGDPALCGALAEAARGGPRPVEVTMYADFQCPGCRASERAMRAARDSGWLSIRLLHYPRDPACNPRMSRNRHPRACLQAYAAVCADTLGRGQPFADQLFDGDAIDEKALTVVAMSVGLDERQFVDCLTSGGGRRQVDRDVEGAMAEGVHGTPTLVVDGRQYTGGLEEADLDCLAKLRQEIR